MAMLMVVLLLPADIGQAGLSDCDGRHDGENNNDDNHKDHGGNET